MRIIVTGGLGFIGSNFISYWLRNHAGDSVTNVDAVTYAADFRNLDQVSSSPFYKFVKADITDYEVMLDSARNADCLVNFAAESHVDNSIDNSDRFVQSNVVGVQRLLEVVRKTDIRFHQVSTDEVYGSLELGSSEKFTENTKYNPRNPYSATKASADFLVRSYHNTYGLPVTISNCSNNYGPNQHPEKLIPKTILNALNENKIPIYGSGNQIRDWIHVYDHCAAIDLVLSRGDYGKTYLVGGNSEKTNNEVIRSILSIMGKGDDLVEYVADRPGHDVRYSIETSPFFHRNGWKQKYSFDEGLRNTVEHYTKNRTRYLENQDIR